MRIGGPDCTKPYDMALMNVSAMSFGALSAPTRSRRSTGARPRAASPTTPARAALSKYHRHGGDLVWEIGSRLLRRRTEDGGFDAAQVRATRRPTTRSRWSRSSSARAPSPASAACCPGAKVTKEIAEARGVPAGREVRLPGVPPGLLDAARAGPVHRPDARALRRQAGRLQALPRLARRLPGDLQGDGRRGRHPRLHHRRRRRGRHRRGAAGVRGPRRYAAHRGPADRAQRAGRRRPARPGQDRRQRQGRHRHRHRQADRPGRRLHQLRARDDDGGRLHPGPDLPHQHLPGRRRDPGPAPDARARRARQDRAGLPLPAGSASSRRCR